MLEISSTATPGCAAESTRATLDRNGHELRVKARTQLSTTPQPPSASSPTPLQRIAWALLIVLTLYLCYFSHLGVIGFVGPDEPRYAWIARDMAESGDWITPRLYGRPWFEKPPLLYWGGALFFKLLGEGHPEVAARLPSAISALLATLALAWLAWRTYGEECARWLLLLLPTSVGMIGFSHACATDMPFAGMLTISLVCAAVILGLVPKTENTPVLPRTPWLALILFGFFEGLAVLAKGPAALILTGGAVFFWALFTKRWRDGLRLLHPAAIAAFCFTALPWYLVCARRNSDFFRIFIIEHNFKRFLTPEFQHTQPFWFYVPILLIAFLPWAAVLVWSAVQAVRKRPSGKLTLLLVLWSAFCLLFFSISQSKLPGYILPAVPVMGLLVARGMQSRAPSEIKTFRVSGAACSLLFAALAFGFWEISRLTAHHSHLNEKAGVAYAILASCFAVANLFFALVHRDRTSLNAMPTPLVVTPVLAAFYFASFFVNSSFEYDPSGKTLAEEIKKPKVKETNVFVGPMDRAKRFSLNFYMKREIPEWDPARPISGLLIIQHRTCQELVPAPYSCNSADGIEGAGARLYSVTVHSSLPGAGAGRQPQ